MGKKTLKTSAKGIHYAVLLEGLRLYMGFVDNCGVFFVWRMERYKIWRYLELFIIVG